MKRDLNENRKKSLTAVFFAFWRETPIFNPVNFNVVILIFYIELQYFSLLVICPDELVQLRKLLSNTELINLLLRFLMMSFNIKGILM